MFSLKELKGEFPELEIISEEEQTFDILLLNFTAPTKKLYDRVTKWLDSLAIEKQAYNIHISYDMSGYDYWVIKQEELNHMMLTLVVSNPEKVNMFELIEDLAVLEEKLQFISQSSIDYFFYPNKTSEKSLKAAINAAIG
jgi:hypothetical protein